ncbi:FtsK/SpoIIIE domain-containing protein [Kitasatospora sp. NPDC048365]|uniref:FtsK/SpoIIIE domain-containing protein n=1 Tax=Kitasatospora sp. NPDC048365 TaxID=3364050 RepID=UPI003717AB9F
MKGHRGEMQIRLTVLRPRSGPAGSSASTDVLVTAPVGTALGAVAGALAGAVGVRGPRSATHVHLYAGSHRLDEQTPLGRPPLVDGAVLSLGEPDPDADEESTEPAAAELRVIGGPDAGGVHRLHGEEVRIGRSSEADVPLDDPDVSRLHLSLHLAADGTVTVRDLGSTNGTVLDDRFLRDGSAELADGALVRIGESTLQLTRPKIGENSGSPRTAAPDGEGHLRLAAQPPARTTLAQPAPAPAPETPGPAGRAFGLLSRRRRAAEPDAPDAGQQHAAARSRQAAAQRERWPDPAALLLTALTTGPRLWERGPAHPDALTVRLGTADLPGGPGTAPGTLLPAVPVTVDLQTAGSLGLSGPRHRLAGLARAVVAQLAALHPPSGLGLVVVAAEQPGPDPDGAPADGWSWAQWLPHLRPTQSQACRLLFGLGPEQAEARLAELATATAGTPATVLVVDGDPGSTAAREALAVLLRQGPAVGVFTVCLADTPEQLPAGLGAHAEITGEVATLLTVERPVGGALQRIDDVALDAVSPAWAERLARVLAPLREAAPAARGPLPSALRLLDLLRLESVSPTKLSARWEALPAGPGAATALLGTSRDDDTCTLDLADPDLLEPGESGGPHLLIGGAPGSGKTELLRTLVASLAVSEHPERLAVTVVEGRRVDAADGLGGCTDLPHVTTHYNAAEDPRQAMLHAQVLLDVLDEREALFGRQGFAEWHAARALDRTPALVGGGSPVDGVAAAARVIEPRRSPDEAPAADGPAPGRTVLVVDDYDALLAPTSPGGRPLARALAEVARRGGRLGVHLIAATGSPEALAGSELDEAALLRIALRTEHAAESDLLVHIPDAASLPEGTPGRGYLRRADGGVTAFQAARVSGRIPRTATLRPTVVATDLAEHGAPPARRPVRELGNGPTDLALLASALQRAAT